MTKLESLLERIIDRVDVNLRDREFEVDEYVRHQTPHLHYSRFSAFYGLSSDFPVNFKFKKSSLTGSYFLGRVVVVYSALYKSDIRGDELKRKGQICTFGNRQIPLHDDEFILIQDSFLNKTLVHSNSHNPETPEVFTIRNTIAMPYSNIHGSPSEGCFIGAFATVDLSSLHDCVVRYFSYIQHREMANETVPPGQVWIKQEDMEFRYQFDLKKLNIYISQEAGACPTGVLMDFVEMRQDDFEEVFASGHIKRSDRDCLAPGSSINGYAVIKGDSHIGPNVLVAQRSYLDNAWLGEGCDAQENCYVVNSRLEAYCVLAHGAKVVDATLGTRIFCGFNSFLSGGEEAPLHIGSGCIIMPHTIIDLEEPLTIPDRTLVWGMINNQKDFESHSMSLDAMEQLDGTYSLGAMTFRGNGKKFVASFEKRIQRILEENGAFFTSTGTQGHAQTNKSITFNIIQPYPAGEQRGMYPTIRILP